MTEILQRLCCASGVGGQREIADVAVEYLRAYTNDITIDHSGNVIATLHAASEPAPTVVLEAHMDEIGFIVTAVDDRGFIAVSPCGGVDCRVIESARVVVWGEQPYHGVVCTVPPHLQKDAVSKAVEADAVWIDIGLCADVAKATVPVGSRVSFAPNFRRLNDTVVTSKALDNRAGMAAVFYALSLLKDKPPVCTVKVVFAVSEELGCRGAAPAAFATAGDAVVVTDVSFAYTPDTKKEQCGVMGKGAMLGISPTLSDACTRLVRDVAQRHNIMLQTEVMGGKTGTDADVISVVRDGIPTTLLSIPLRYMHTPVEMVDTRDICAVGACMAAFIEEGARWL